MYESKFDFLLLVNSESPHEEEEASLICLSLLSCDDNLLTLPQVETNIWSLTSRK